MDIGNVDDVLVFSQECYTFFHTFFPWNVQDIASSYVDLYIDCILVFTRQLNSAKYPYA